MHVADEILAERDEEQDSYHTAEQRTEENLEERYCHVGILGLQDIDGRQSEDGSCHHGSRTGSDALDDDVLAQCLAALGGCRHSHGDDGDRNGCLKHLTHLESEVGGSG